MVYAFKDWSLEANEFFPYLTNLDDHYYCGENLNLTGFTTDVALWSLFIPFVCWKNIET